MAHTPTRATTFLTGLATLLLAVGIAYAAFLVVGAVAGFGPNGDHVAVHAQVPAERIADLPPDTVVPDEVDVTVSLDDASDAQHRWAAARDLVLVLVVLAAVWLLRGILTSVRDGSPFIGANVKRLRALALVVVVGVPLATFLSSIFAAELATSAGLESAGTELGLPANALLGGLALLVLSEVFAYGVRLREDVEGTV